jgi:hypothetical protein
MSFIEWSSSTIREGTWSFTKVSPSIYLQGVVCNVLNGSSSMIREGTWTLAQLSLSILFGGSRDVIN